jgi:hypothetical protein
MMYLKNAKIQILDVPGLIEGAEVGKGRGREVLSVIRGCDLLILISEVGKENAFDRIKAALEKNGIRIDKEPPKITIEKKHQGGVIVHSNIHQPINKDVIGDIVAEMGLKNAEITIKERLTVEQLIDGLSRNRVYIPSINVINKIDLGEKYKINNEDTILISAEKIFNLDKLKERIFQKLKFITVYLVKINEDPGYGNPLVVKENTKLSDILKTLGSNFSENKVYAKIWGTGAKFPGQEVSLTSLAEDGMQIRFI